MTIRHFAVAALLVFANVTSAQAQLLPEITNSCNLPTLPPSQASKLEWQVYSSNLKVYQECMTVKAEKVGKTTKKALETVGEGATKTKEGIEAVGEKVIGWKATASGWFSN